MATSKTRNWTLDLDPEKPGPRKIYTLKNLGSEKPGPWKTWPWKTWTLKNMGFLKNGADFKELCFIKIMHNLFFCGKVCLLTDIYIFQAIKYSYNNTTVILKFWKHQDIKFRDTYMFLKFYVSWKKKVPTHQF